MGYHFSQLEQSQGGCENASEWERRKMDHRQISISDAETVPAELVRQIPRKTRISDVGITTAVVATGFLVLAIIGTLWLSMHAATHKQAFIVPIVPAVLGILFLVQFPKQRKLVAEGMPAVGVITKCGRARGGFYVNYEFHTEDGKLASGSSLSDSRKEIGENIWVLHLPDNPRRNGPYPFDYYRVVG
jgi:hypothetical protein